MRIAVTGGIGSGKSAVARLLAARGAVVVDADAHRPRGRRAGHRGAGRRSSREFGDEVLAPDGSSTGRRWRRSCSPTRAARGAQGDRAPAACGAPAARAAGRGRPPAGVVVYDVPLLVENGQRRARTTWWSWSTRRRETQVGRLVRHRGMSEADARARIGRPGHRRAAPAVAGRRGDRQRRRPRRPAGSGRPALGRGLRRLARPYAGTGCRWPDVRLTA